MVFGRLVRFRDAVKNQLDKIYYKYGLLCATHPLPMISTSVVIVILCSLPILSLPVFERTATFLFGRITFENYHSNVTLATYPSVLRKYHRGYIQQVHFMVNVSSETDMVGTDAWILLHQFTPILNLTSTLHRDEKGGPELAQLCMKTTRRPFYRSPHTRLLYPKGRFYAELKKWFPRNGCLVTGPSVIAGISERKRDELHEAFKELILGLPLNDTRLTDNLKGNQHQLFVTYTFFLESSDDMFLTLLESKLADKGVKISQHSKNETFDITYFPLEDRGPVELIPLTLTYLLVFLYLLFSVAKLEMLKSRWGLAFAAFMTMVLSLAMAVGICASFDAIPSTMTIKEILPYLVIIIGLENVLIVTKSVLSTPVNEDVIIRVAMGMEREGWYMTKTVLVELLILGAGYFTMIASLQEFCAFASVGVLSDFFLQLVFFTPVLAVDLRRAEMSDLERQSFEEQFRRGFNLPATFTDALSRRLRVVSYWARTRIVQRGFMVGCVVYISFVVYHQVKGGVTLEQRTSEKTNELDTKPDASTGLSPASHPGMYEQSHSKEHLHRFRCLGEEEKWNQDEHFSWQLLCKQHWLELFAYYHIPQSDRTLQILPQIDVVVPVHLSAKDIKDIEEIADRSRAIFIRGALITTAVLVCVGTMFSLIWLCCIFCGRSRRNTKGGCRVTITRVSLAGHTHRIKMAVSTGAHVITCCLYGNIRIWDPVADKCLVHLDRRKLKSVNCTVEGDPASSSFDCELLTEYEQHLHEACAVRNLPNIWGLAAKAETIAAGCSNGDVEIFSLRRRKRIATFAEETSPVTAVKVSSRSSVIAGRRNGLIDFLEILRTRFDSLRELDALTQPESYVTELDESEGLCHCVLKHRLRGHSHAITWLESVGGKVLSACIDGSFKIYDGEDKIGLFSLQPQGSMITSCHVSTDDQFVSLFGYEDGRLCAVNLLAVRGLRPRMVGRHSSAIMAIRADAKFIYTLGADNVVYISEIREDEEIVRCYRGKETIHSIEILGQHVLVVVCESSLVLLDGKNGHEIDEVASRSRSPRFPSSMNVCSVDQSTVAIARGKKLDLYRFPSLVDKRD